MLNKTKQNIKQQQQKTLVLKMCLYKIAFIENILQFFVKMFSLR